MIYGYARVSTKGQAKDGNSLEAQEKALRDAGAGIFTIVREMDGWGKLKSRQGWICLKYAERI